MIFENIIFSQFIKELRIKENINLQQLSLKTNYNISSLSRYEHSNNLTYEKAEPIFNCFNIDKDYINSVTTDYSNSISKIIDLCIQINPSIDDLYIQSMKKYIKYENTIFSIGLDLCKIVYASYNNELNSIPTSLIEYLLDKIEYFTKEYQGYCYIYIGRYYYIKKQFNFAIKYYKLALSLVTTDKAQAMLQYFMSLYYIYNDDYLKSIKYSETASTLFQKEQLYYRLININILYAKQYSKIKDYKKSLEINLLNLETINQPQFSHLTYERRVILNNIAWTYLIMSNYEKSIYYYNLIPIELKHSYHYLSCALSFYFLDEFNESLIQCKLGLSCKNIDTLHLKLLNWLNQYLEAPNLSKNEKILIQIINTEPMDLDLKIVLYQILTKIYENKKQYKNAFNISKIINELLLL